MGPPLFVSGVPRSVSACSQALSLNLASLRCIALLVMSVIGGSKASAKLPVIQGLLDQADTLILMGGLAFGAFERFESFWVNEEEPVGELGNDAQKHRVNCKLSHSAAHLNL